MQEQLVQSIVGVYQNDGVTPKKYTSISASYTASKYTSTKQPIWRLMIDGTETTRKTSLLIQYKCLSCTATSTVSMLSFLRKLNKQSPEVCYMCRNQNEEKRKVHSVWMTGKNIRALPIKVTTRIDARELHFHAKRDFLNLSQESRANYWRRHLTDQKMSAMMPYIQSLRNGNIPSERLQRCQYWDVFPSGNQMRFTPVFYDPVDDEVIRIDQPIIRCEQCNNNWRCKNMQPLVGCKKILCASCKLCRRTFKIRGTTNIGNEKLVYQSKPEKQFIDWCAQNNIVVKNGPSLSYEFQSKEKVYKVDFLIPSIGYLVEVKDDHCWHRKQIESGQWLCKEQAANDAIARGDYERFLLLTPTTKANCLQNILKRISKI